MVTCKQREVWVVLRIRDRFKHANLARWAFNLEISLWLEAKQLLGLGLRFSLELGVALVKGINVSVRHLFMVKFSPRLVIEWDIL